MARAPWGRTTWIVPLLLFLAVLLVAGLAFNLAHLDTGGESLPGVPSPGGATPSSPPPSPTGSTGANALAVVFIVLLGVGVVALLARRRKVVGRVRETSWWDVIGTVIALGVILVLLMLWPRNLPLLTNVTAGQNTTAGAGTGPVEPTVSGIPLAVFLAGGILAALFVIAFVVRANALLRPSGPRTPRDRQRRDAAAVLDRTIAEIQLGGDVREAILACYRRFCELLGRRGLDGQTALTPREIEARAVARLSVPTDAADALTSLFEEARYSVHALGPGDRDRAVRSLEGIRASLEA